MFLNTPTRNVEMFFNMYRDMALEIQLEAEFAKNITDIEYIREEMKLLNNRAVSFEGAVQRMGTTVGISYYIEEFNRLRDETNEAVAAAEAAVA